MYYINFYRNAVSQNFPKPHSSDGITSCNLNDLYQCVLMCHHVIIIAPFTHSKQNNKQLKNIIYYYLLVLLFNCLIKKNKH